MRKHTFSFWTCGDGETWICRAPEYRKMHDWTMRRQARDLANSEFCLVRVYSVTHGEYNQVYECGPAVPAAVPAFGFGYQAA